jgi:hypothetical protein
LSTKEEADLESLMSQCEFAISNAEAFSEQLSKDLSSLDGVRKLFINLALIYNWETEPKFLMLVHIQVLANSASSSNVTHRDSECLMPSSRGIIWCDPVSFPRIVLK